MIWWCSFCMARYFRYYKARFFWMNQQPEWNKSFHCSFGATVRYQRITAAPWIILRNPSEVHTSKRMFDFSMIASWLRGCTQDSSPEDDVEKRSTASARMWQLLRIMYWSLVSIITCTILYGHGLLFELNLLKNMLNACILLCLTLVKRMHRYYIDPDDKYSPET